MRSLTLVWRRLLVLVACLSVLSGAVQPQLHDLLIEHVFCAEHQTLEHAPLDAGDHGEACEWLGALSGPPVLETRIVRAQPAVVFPAVVPLRGACSPRAPPLSFAPKTSPPSTWI